MDQNFSTSNNTPPQIPQVPTVSPPNRKKALFYILIFVGLAVLAGAIFAAYYLGKNQNSSQQNQQQVIENKNSQGEKQIATSTPLDFSIDLVKGATFEVNWNADLIKLPCPKLSNCEYAEYYDAGRIKSGPFAGQTMVLAVVQEMGTSFYHYILPLLEASSTAQSLEELNVQIKGVTDLPKEIPLLGTSYKLTQFYSNTLFKDLKISKKLFNNPTLGDFYLTQEGCIMVQLPDKTAMAYSLVIPFVNQENGQLYININNGSIRNDDRYVYNRITGCGALCYYLATMDEAQLKPDQRLQAVAKTGLGEDIFALKDREDTALKALYNDKNTMPYMGDVSTNYSSKDQSKYTYEEFLSYNPLLYWKDPLGRWIEFKNSRFEVAAEMCKPVIYLYPEKTENLTVKVSPNGGFTYSSPAYDQGWKVLATPEGQLTDLRTNKNYDYLFWEGIGLNYPIETNGFVVAKQDLKKFFDEKLAVLGLNEKEKTDFENYWLGRLDGKPYYKLSFLKQVQFDQLAPLNISPIKPNTAIRVMMTAEGLDQPKQVVPQILEPAPIRKGFTVVEWGGVVLK